MSDPLSPDPVRSRGGRDLPAYVSNGLVGLRVRDVPLVAGMALVSGFAGEHSERRIEAATIAPCPLAGDVAINGVWLSDAPHQVRDHFDALVEQLVQHGMSERERADHFLDEVKAVTAVIIRLPRRGHGPDCVTFAPDGPKPISAAQFEAELADLQAALDAPAQGRGGRLFGGESPID